MDPQDGPGRKLAEFLGGVIVAATDPEGKGSRLPCFQCGGNVTSRITNTVPLTGPAHDVARRVASRTGAEPCGT